MTDISHIYTVPELLCPAGNPEKLRTAVLYGADAVYLSGNDFGMRAAADNFTLPEIAAAAVYAHRHGVKVYITINTMPRWNEFDALECYLSALARLPESDGSDSFIDAVIAADLGVAALVREYLPDTALHVSTQAGVVNHADCAAWYRLGAKRIVLARELSLNDIKEIRRRTPPDIELEVFMHGSMCVSYSGRCLLSNHFTRRDANRGMCTQPCRWNYRLYEIEEEKRPDKRLPLIETDRGTFILSSRDMCMIEHIPELCECGITSLKIEGRMKSAYYAAVTANIYRMALDSYASGGYIYDPLWKRELQSVSHRPYCSGYFFDDPMENAQMCGEDDAKGYIREKAYIAAVESYDPQTGIATMVQRNKISRGDTAELITPGKTGRAFTADMMWDKDGNEIGSAPHPSMVFKIRLPFEASEGDIIRL
jgi:U32 family peptidase